LVEQRGCSIEPCNGIESSKWAIFLQAELKMHDEREVGLQCSTVRQPRSH